MNYIIFKGVCSKHIEGLLISELPPITKPKMKTSITKIDGKDGDIIDKLGYESYSKSLTIGLTRNFNMDEIMSYFNGGGEVIFSNEPDKIYHAEILDKIDYERLVRFRKAKINFYTQPYKYLLDEPPFILNVSNEKEFKVANAGLEESKPVLTLYGSGEVSIQINGIDYFTITIDDEYVVVDSLKEDAYKGRVLKNRQMLGEFPVLKQGINIITWTGNLTKIKVEPKSRWL